ncbi:MAG TPA: hypothetical protein VG186_09700 [Solirubrobacteraceae bacterium]|jgi:hypothetical protein|nr:hypothetical protein [Solirubrobacteraceae bacterium]
MPNHPEISIILGMTRPLTASRVLLVADRREPPSDLRAAPLRRFRLARLRLDGRNATPRYEQVKNV